MEAQPTIHIVLITGMSGAGKSHAINCFEDLGYFCVDNLPPTLLPKFAELCAQLEGRLNKVALVSDLRGGEFFNNLFEALQELDSNRIDYEILFLEADDEVLIRRFKETRRRHPLADLSLREAIDKERQMLAELRGKADRVIDTSSLSPRELKETIANLYEPEQREKSMFITIISFGFKYGLPLDADLVFDVRFLPNPHYVQHLRSLTGQDPQVKDYIWRWMVTHKYLQKVHDLLEFSIPYYIREGKSNLVIAVGCTGGKHRSVALAEEIGRLLGDRYRVNCKHRDMHKA
ncbi:MAG TPA: RNase adapter RapZ [Bacillota bacterium]|nr:RNase adapter RapZ [Bacillota bacterium]